MKWEVYEIIEGVGTYYFLSTFNPITNTWKFHVNRKVFIHE